MGAKATDISGRKFARLTVIRRDGRMSDGSVLWLCRCDCGAQRSVPSRVLKSGKVKSCRSCRELPAGCWSAAEDQRLRDLYPTRDVHDIASLFDRTPKALRSRAKVLSLRKAKQRKEWTAADFWMLRTFYPHVKTEILARRLGATVASMHHNARKLGLLKSSIYLASPDACRLRRGDNVGAAYRFRKGQVSHNKGLRRPGWSVGKMRETQFKKGQQPSNTMPIWSFRFVNGYLMLKTGAPTPKPTTGWEYVHKLIWEPVMISELSNFVLFLYAIAKVLILTGLGLAGVIVVMAECCGFKVVAFGFEQVRGGQLAAENRVDASASIWATSLPRKKVRAVA